MEGKIIHDKIYVDCWQEKQVGNSCYFISKLHAKWNNLINENWKHPIYSSKLNLKYLTSCTKVDKTLLKPLVFNKQTTMTVDDFQFKVTAVDSGSYTGKIIYHFSFEGSEILYMDGALTSPEILSNPYLLQLSSNKTIDTVYIDTQLLRTPVDFSIKKASNHIIKLLQSSNLIMAMPYVGMEDLLVSIASCGYSIHVGNKRERILQLQEVNLNITRSKEVALRIVELKHFEDIERCHKRYLEKQLIHVILSPFYTLAEAEALQKLGLHVVYYSDNTAPKTLISLLKVIQPKKLQSCGTEELDAADLLNQYMQFSEVDTSLNSTYLTPAQRIEEARETSKSTESFTGNMSPEEVQGKDQEGTRSMPPEEVHQEGNSFTRNMSLEEVHQNNHQEEISLGKDMSQEEVHQKKNLEENSFTRNMSPEEVHQKNQESENNDDISPLFPNTQEPFAPLATSTQKMTQEKEEAGASTTNLPLSQRDLAEVEQNLINNNSKVYWEQCIGSQETTDDSTTEINLSKCFFESATPKTKKRSVAFDSALNKVHLIENINYADEGEDFSMIIPSSDGSDDESYERVIPKQSSQQMVIVDEIPITNVAVSMSQESHFSNISDIGDSLIASSSQQMLTEDIIQLQQPAETSTSDSYASVMDPEHFIVLKPCSIQLERTDISKIPMILTERQQKIKKQNEEILEKFEKLAIPNLETCFEPMIFSDKFLEHIDANFIDSTKMSEAIMRFSLDNHLQYFQEHPIKIPKKRSRAKKKN